MTTDARGDHDTARVTDRASTALAAYHALGTWDKAAEAAGYTNRGSAYRAVMQLLGKRTDTTIHALRTEANQRHAEKIAMLEDIIYNLETPLTDRLRAVAEHTRAEHRHAALNGLDAPKQVVVSAGVLAQMEEAFGQLRLIVGEGGDVVEGEATEVPPEALEA